MGGNHWKDPRETGVQVPASEPGGRFAQPPHVDSFCFIHLWWGWGWRMVQVYVLKRNRTCVGQAAWPKPIFLLIIHWQSSPFLVQVEFISLCEISMIWPPAETLSIFPISDLLAMLTKWTKAVKKPQWVMSLQTQLQLSLLLSFIVWTDI